MSEAGAGRPLLVHAELVKEVINILLYTNKAVMLGEVLKHVSINNSPRDSTQHAG